jgi:aspartyl/asparaginyl beta-hydroxylase (cupin superfamily)
MVTFSLFRYGKIKENCRLSPRTTEIVESLPLCDKVVGFVYFSMMVPGTMIKPHCGPVNTRIRYHLTLSHDEQTWIRVDDQRRSLWTFGIPDCLW